VALSPGRFRGGHCGPSTLPLSPYGHLMATASTSPELHPRRSAALAAHALREALAELGVLDEIPKCAAEVIDGRAVVELGPIDAAVAVILAERLRSRKARRRGRAVTPGADQDAGNPTL